MRPEPLRSPDTGSPERAAEIAREVQAARVEFAFNGLPLSLVVSVILAGMTAVVLRGSAPVAVVAAWFGCLTGVNAVRLLHYRHYRSRRRDRDLDVPVFDRQLLIGCFASGVVWGSSALLFLPHAPELQFFLAFVIAGVSSGAVTSLSVAPYAVYAFVVPCVLPLALRFLFAGDVLHVVMGVMICFYMGVVALVARRGHTQLALMVQSEVRRHASDERLRVAADAGQIGVWEWDLRTDELIWDERMHEIYRVAPTADSDYRGVWRLRVHPTDLARVEADLAAAVASATRFKSEFRIVWPDGEERYIEAAAHVQHAQDGSAFRLVGINLDVTELKRLERVKSEFMSTVSHELRTPLTSIRGSLGLVLGDVAGPVAENAKGLLRVADRNAERLGALIEDLLDAENFESGNLRLDLQEQPLQPLIRQALDANTPYAAQHQVTFELNNSAAGVTARVDGKRILQVMTNLLSNAVKFSPREATVLVTIAQPTPQRVRVEVQDHGPGISPQFRTKIFTLFTQGDASDSRPKGGTGLGLAISKALIEHMGGVIGFVPGNDGGTTFFFELPVGLLGAEDGRKGGGELLDQRAEPVGDLVR
jgi:signal transduction histidine kinase